MKNSESSATSLSVYRGQADSGIGEGINQPVAYGEQYLHGTAVALRNDATLSAIRPWLTLDSTEADHRALNDRLEAWSCFSEGERLFVARLTATRYNQRIAYFSHGRAWNLADCRSDFDPGVYLGYSDLFDAPAGERGSSDPEQTHMPPSNMPERWKVIVEKEPDTAIAFLGYLLQALFDQSRLLIAAPIHEFHPGSSLFTLVAFARAALPADQKYACNIRIYARQFQLFTGRVNSQLIIFPEDRAHEALRTFQGAILLNHRGELKNGSPLTDGARDYAERVIECFLNRTEGLLPFSAFFVDNRRDAVVSLASDGNIHSILFGYQLATDLISDNPDYAKILGDLKRIGSTNTHWRELLTPQDWAKFPEALLEDFILEIPDSLSPGERALQEVVTKLVAERGDVKLDARLEGGWQNDQNQLSRILDLWEQGLFSDAIIKKSMAPALFKIVPHPSDSLNNKSKQLQIRATKALDRLNLTLDSYLDNGWKDIEQDVHQRKRFVELYQEHPNLFSDKTKLARKTVKISLNDWSKTKVSLIELLSLELQAGALEERVKQESELSILFNKDKRKVFDFLMKATVEGRLTTNWILILMDTNQREYQDILLAIARSRLITFDSMISWRSILIEILDCLRRWSTDIPNDIRDRAIQQSNNLNFVKVEDIDLYLRLAELVGPDNSKYYPPNNVLMDRLLNEWNRSSGLLSNEVRNRLESTIIDTAFSDQWSCLSPTSLVTEQGDISVPHLQPSRLAQLLLETDETLKILNIECLIRLFVDTWPQLSEDRREAIYRQITQQWIKDPPTTTFALIRRDTWYSWQRVADADLRQKGFRRRAALVWLSCPLWTMPEDLFPGEVYPEATLEAWKQAMEDLQSKKLSRAEIRNLRINRDGPPLWPWIQEFEEEQLRDLHQLPNDLVAFRELMDAIEKSDESIRAINNDALASSPFRHVYDLYLRLKEKQSCEPIDEDMWNRMLEFRGSEIISVRIANIMNGLDTEDPDQKFANLLGADSPSLWRSQEFLQSLANWIKIHMDQNDFLERLDKCIKVRIPRLEAPIKELSLQLLNEGFLAIAVFLWSEVLSNTRPAGHFCEPENTKSHDNVDWVNGYYQWLVREKQLPESSLETMTLEAIMFKQSDSHLSMVWRQVGEMALRIKSKDKSVHGHTHPMKVLTRIFRNLRDIPDHYPKKLPSVFIANLLNAIATKEYSLFICLTEANSNPTIPSLEFLIALSLISENESDGPGSITCDFIERVHELIPKQEEQNWWRALLTSMFTSCSTSKQKEISAQRIVEFANEMPFMKANKDRMEFLAKVLIESKYSELAKSLTN